MKQLFLILVIFISACGTKDNSSTEQTTSTPSISTPSGGGGVVVAPKQLLDQNIGPSILQSEKLYGNCSSYEKLTGCQVTEIKYYYDDNKNIKEFRLIKNESLFFHMKVVKKIENISIGSVNVGNCSINADDTIT